MTDTRTQLEKLLAQRILVLDGSETTGSIGVLLDGRTFEAVAEDDLVISHFDIPPRGPEYLGVETRDRRVV